MQLCVVYAVRAAIWRGRMYMQVRYMLHQKVTKNGTARSVLVPTLLYEGD